MVVYPTVTRSSKCFDVYTQQALRRGGGSDPVGIRSMVEWAIQNRAGDRNRVYVTGASSGAMMTNVLLGDYPDVFKAGAAFSGVPATCFATTPPNEWNSNCSGGNIIRSAQQWTNVAGLSQTPTRTDSPQSGWTPTRYGGTGATAQVEGISIQNGGHDLPRPGMAAMAIAFFGLNT